MGKVKIAVKYYPNGFGLMKDSSWQNKTFEDEMAAIEWCRKNYKNIGVINNYRTLGQQISHFEIMDAIRGVAY